MAEALVGYQEPQTENNQRDLVDGEIFRERQPIIDITQFDPVALRAVSNIALQRAIERRLHEHESGKEITVRHDSSFINVRIKVAS